MRFEGHSYFWHFLLCIFAKTGLPYESTKILQLFFALSFAFLVLKKSPYNDLVKCCLLFNSVFIYILPSLLRPYFLIPILLMMLSNLKNDDKHQILFGIILCLLANTHIIMFGYVITIFVIYYKNRIISDNKKTYISLIIAVIGILNALACAFFRIIFFYFNSKWK